MKPESTPGVMRAYLEQMLEEGQIGIVGAMHDIESGKVIFYDDVMYIKDDLNPEFTVAALRH